METEILTALSQQLSAVLDSVLPKLAQDWWKSRVVDKATQGTAAYREIVQGLRTGLRAH